MREGVMTEREWRKQAWRTKERMAHCWGAQCMLPVIDRRPKSYRRYRRYAAWSLLAAILGSTALFWAFFTAPTAEYPILPALSESVETLSKEQGVRPNSAVTYQYPDIPQKQVNLTRDELMRGKMMRIDGQHPLPEEAPAPNTVSIAIYGKGMVPVRDLTLKTGKKTTEALENLFAEARKKGIEGLTVWRGATSEAEQRELQLSRMRIHSAAMSLQDAVETARQEVEDPRTSDFQQEYTIDIRLCAMQSDIADDRPLGLTEQGRFLLQTAWRHGFIRRFPRENDNPFKAYQFRFVGVAHSTAMTYLDLDFESYLALLHEKQVVQIRINGEVKYVIVCKFVSGDYVSLMLPEGAEYDFSYDNMGYAIAACTFS